MPIHGGMLDRKFNGRAALAAGMSADNVILPRNGSMVEFDQEGKVYDAGEALLALY